MFSIWGLGLGFVGIKGLRLRALGLGFFVGFRGLGLRFVGFRGLGLKIISWVLV